MSCRKSALIVTIYCPFKLRNWQDVCEIVKERAVHCVAQNVVTLVMGLAFMAALSILCFVFILLTVDLRWVISNADGK